MQLQQSAVPELLRVDEVLGVFAALYPRSVGRDELLARVGLERRRRARAGRLSGATIPLQVMPARVQAWAACLPLHYVVRLMQTLWAGGSWSEEIRSLLVLVGVLAVSAAVSTRLFRWE